MQKTFVYGALTSLLLHYECALHESYRQRRTCPYVVAVQHERGPRNSTIRRRTVNYQKKIDDVSLPPSSVVSPYWTLSCTAATPSDVTTLPFNATLLRHPVPQVMGRSSIVFACIHFISIHPSIHVYLHQEKSYNVSKPFGHHSPLSLQTPNSQAQQILTILAAPCCDVTNRTQLCSHLFSLWLVFVIIFSYTISKFVLVFLSLIILF